MLVNILFIDTSLIKCISLWILVQCLYYEWVRPLLRSTEEGLEGCESVFICSTLNSCLSTNCLHTTATLCHQLHHTGIYASFSLFFKTLSAVWRSEFGVRVCILIFKHVYSCGGLVLPNANSR